MTNYCAAETSIARVVRPDDACLWVGGIGRRDINVPERAL